MPARLLIVGRTGQLATELLANPGPHEVIAFGRDRMDLADVGAIAAGLADAAPDAVINAAAYTAVDKAESEPDLAFALNRDGPAALATACADRGIPLVHISTDYVFDGAKSAPYVETDTPNPVSVYGRSKLEGEIAVRDTGARAAIIRTSWVYSAHGANFVKTMLRLAETRDEIGVVGDQFGRPTWAHDLAAAAIAAAGRLLDNDPAANDLFHYSGTGDATWAEFAAHIFTNAKELKLPYAAVKRITTAEFPTPVRRPENSRLSTAKFESVFGPIMRDWREACDMCMRELSAAAR